MKILITEIYDIEDFKLSKAEIDVVEYNSEDNNFAIVKLTGDRNLLFEIKLNLSEKNLTMRLKEIIQTIENRLGEYGLAFKKESVYFPYEIFFHTLN